MAISRETPHSLRKTTLRLPSEAAGPAALALIASLHAIPGVLNAATSGSGDRVVVLHDSAVPVGEILRSAEGAGAYVTLARDVAGTASDGTPIAAPRSGARSIAIAIIAFVLALEMVHRFADVPGSIMR